MGFDLIGRAVHDVHAPAVRLPSRDAGGEVLVRIGNAPVVLFLKFVFDGVGSGIPALPEGLDELVALFVIRELLEGGAFFVGDDPADVLVEPLFVRARYFLLEALFVGLLFLFAERAPEGIYLVFLRFLGGIDRRRCIGIRLF